MSNEASPAAGIGLQRVLIANRGEIALRIVRACVDAQVECVVAVSDADRDTSAALLADRAVCIGPGPAAASYLDIDRVLSAASISGCDAIHPGYGFLSERPELAEACEEHGITFVGPSAETIRRGGDKAEARALAARLGIPVGSGSDVVADSAQAKAAADAIGYPVVLKAAAGGGGRGMVPVHAPSGLEAAFDAASREAEQAFGDGRMFVERFITHARHVEVQILGDRHGSVVHLGDRDCSAQRRYQKLIEEAPATAIDASTREALCAAAVELGHGLGYVGAGTVEFIVDANSGHFSFLEINTRIQVEHPVTELVTGIDLVRAQLEIAGGRGLPYRQRDIRIAGHAIEARVNAEDPSRGFVPHPGTVTRFVPPVGADIRVDSHLYGGYTVPPFYDSLVAKVLARADDRVQAIDRLRHALDRLVIEGFPTTARLARDLLGHPDFAADLHHTRWVEQMLEEHPTGTAT